MFRLARLIPLLALLTLPGCGGPTLYPVSGKVLVDGEPLTKGFVVYHPDDNQQIAGADLPRGELDKCGVPSRCGPIGRWGPLALMK